MPATDVMPLRDCRASIGRFLEVYVQCPIDELVRRDTKGLYARALAGSVPNLTGISDPYEEPLSPEVTVRTDLESLDESIARVLAAITYDRPFLREPCVTT